MVRMVVERGGEEEGWEEVRGRRVLSERCVAARRW